MTSGLLPRGHPLTKPLSLETVQSSIMRLAARLIIEQRLYQEAEDSGSSPLEPMAGSLRAVLRLLTELGFEQEHVAALVHLELAVERLAAGKPEPTLAPKRRRGRPKDNDRIRQYQKVAAVMSSLLHQADGLTWDDADAAAARMALKYGIFGDKEGELAGDTVRDWRLDAGPFGNSEHVRNILNGLYPAIASLGAAGADRVQLAEDIVATIMAIPGLA